MPNIKEHSKGNFDVKNPTWETLQIGAILRIADATERMASNYVQLQNNVEYYKNLSRSRLQEIEVLKHSRAGYMAALTKLRKRIAESNVSVIETEDSNDLSTT
jgi:hypothetical protein